MTSDGVNGNDDDGDDDYQDDHDGEWRHDAQNSEDRRDELAAALLCWLEHVEDLRLGHRRASTDSRVRH